MNVITSQYSGQKFLAQNVNCKIVVTSPTGASRTFFVRQGRPGDWDSHMRTVYVGGSKAGEGRAFAEVRIDGSIRVFMRHLVWGSVFPKYARMLEHPEIYRPKGAIYAVTVYCRRCGRRIEKPSESDPGLGPTCAARGSKLIRTRSSKSSG